MFIMNNLHLKKKIYNNDHYVIVLPMDSVKFKNNNCTV